MNSVRSAISFFTLDKFSLSEDVYIKRLFKFFYKERPLRPKYTTFWPVATLLDYLKTLHPMEELSLKLLTLKTVALIALTSSDRGQSIHLANINNMSVAEDHIDFVIKDRIKTTKKFLKPTIVRCVVSNIDELNVAKYATFHI